MDEVEAVQTLLDLVEQLNIPYMLVGSLSSNAYGVARATQDADLVVVMQPQQLARLKAMLPDGFHLDPQASFETVTGKTRHVIEIDRPMFTVELFELGDGPFDASRFARRRLMDFDGRPRYMQTAEDVVLQKLHWFHRIHRRKDQDDVRDVLRLQHSRLDWDYIREWSGRLGITQTLKDVLDSLPKM